MKILANLIYILQSEYYDTGRFLGFVYTHWAWWRLSERGRVDWTMRARAVAVLTVVLICVDIAGAWWWGNSTAWGGGVWAAIAAVFWVCALPLAVVLADWLVRPLVWWRKRGIISKARRIIEGCANLTVIGITGSYGKTTTKEILSTILAEKLKVVKTPENINTDIGVAQFVIAQRDNLRKTDVLVVEMGAHRRGDIAEICLVTPPDYSILTGITSAHLERFGSLGAIIDTKFELPKNTDKYAVLNCDDSNIAQNYQKQLGDVSVDKFCVKSDIAQNVRFKPRFAGIEFEVDGQKFQTALVAEHNISLILLARQIALQLGLSDVQIAGGVAKIAQIPHRLEVTHNTIANRTIIDDSYNGNVVGAHSALDLLSRAEGRTVVLTPGLVELGEQSVEAHRQLGRRYAQTVDLVLLIQSPQIEFIIEGLRESGFAQFEIYASAREAHDDLARVLRDGDTILFQNDIGDNYL